MSEEINTMNTTLVATKETIDDEQIVAAAVQIQGVTLSLPKPARHGQILHTLETLGISTTLSASACQGFLTSEGRFVNRIQGRQIAHIAGQNPKTTGSPRDLYSEDLW